MHTHAGSWGELPYDKESMSMETIFPSPAPAMPAPAVGFLRLLSPPSLLLATINEDLGIVIICELLLQVAV